MPGIRAVQAAVLGTVLSLTLLGSSSSTAVPPETTASAQQTPEQLTVRVLETLPHDTTAFTQGLELVDGVLYEGTGLVGQSHIRATDFADGQELARDDLPSPYFGEGITLTDTSLWQLTWLNGTAFERDPQTLAVLRTVSYEGEGWGLCYQEDADRLVMSNGSGTLTFRDPVSFEPTGTVTVPGVTSLNELECVGEDVYANVWYSDTILRIDPEAGAVTAEIDASGLLTEEEAWAADVLNGIAHVAGTEAFLITGKLWPPLFRVEFLPSSVCGPTATDA